MDFKTRGLYEFGRYQIDVSERLLLRDGRPVQLTPKAFDLLSILVRNDNHLLTKEELMKEIWPDSFVEEANLAVNVSALRKLLGDKSDGQPYIETVPRRGYRFSGDVRERARDKERDSAAALPSPQAEITESTISDDALSPIESARPPTAQPQGPHRQFGTPRLVVLAALSLALIVAAIVLVTRLRSPVKLPPTKTRSLAVLPFKPLGSQPDDQYLGLGMADALITRLGALREIVVRPTGTVRRFAAVDQDPIAAGRQLGVETVLEGSIQHLGGRLRVTVRLIRVDDGAALWAETFDQDFTDMFGVEDSISQQVTKALALQLTGDEQQQLSKRYTASGDAYQLYLRGRYFWGKRTTAGVNQGIDYFERAIAADPRYALAYAGLADSYLLQGSAGYSELRPQEAMPKAKAAAEHALAIDETLADAHTSLAYVKLIYEWDWPGSEKEFNRALSLNPSNTTAHHWYSHYLTAMGRHEESIAEAKRALDLDPVDLSLNEHLGWTYLMARQYDRTIEECRRTLEMDPGFALAHRRLGEAYQYQKKYPEAIAEFQKGLELSGGAIVYQALLGRAYAAAGRRSDAIRIIDELQKLSKQKYVSAATIATVYIDLGDRDQAFLWLRKATDERCDSLAYSKVDPAYDNLRSDPRWSGLLRQLQLN